MKITIQSSSLTLMVLLFKCISIYAQQYESIDERIKFIDANVTSIKDFEKQNPNKLKVFEANESNTKLKLTELDEMPERVNEDSLFMIYILKDDNGKVLMHELDPTSQSGDWSASFTHYFDHHERTIMFEFNSGSFNSGCTDILRIKKQYYFDEKFNLIKNVNTYTDKNGKPINNFEECDTYGIQRVEPNIFRTYKDITTQKINNLTPYVKNESK